MLVNWWQSRPNIRLSWPNIRWESRQSWWCQDFESSCTCNPFLILRSLLQWRWQWASIGHFVFLLSPRLMDQQIVISTLYHPSLPNVQWRLSIVTHCNLWLFIYPCISYTSTKHLRTNILTSGSVFPLNLTLRYTYIAHCFWQWFKNQISEIRFQKSRFHKSDLRNQILEIGFQKYFVRNQILDITARDVPS